MIGEQVSCFITNSERIRTSSIIQYIVTNWLKVTIKYNLNTRSKKLNQLCDLLLLHLSV